MKFTTGTDWQDLTLVLAPENLWLENCKFKIRLDSSGSPCLKIKQNTISAQ